MTRPENETHHAPEVDESNSPEATIVQPRSEEVKFEPMPVVNDGLTSFETDGNGNDNLQRRYVDIISINSTPVSSPRDIHSDGAAVPSFSELNRATSAPDADVENTTSNMGANIPDQPTQVNTVSEPSITSDYWSHILASEPDHVPRVHTDHLATIAQNGLNHNLGLSDFVPPGTTEQIRPREDNGPMITPPISNCSPTFPFGNPVSHAPTIPPRAEDSRHPFNNQSRALQNHRPHTPLVENRSHTSAVPSGYSQPQPQMNNTFVPTRPEPTPGMVQEQPRVQEQQARVQEEQARVQEQPRARVPDPRHTDQHGPGSSQGDQGAAAQANHHGLSGYDGIMGVGNEAPRPPATYQEYMNQPVSERPWGLNGPRRSR